jgi:uncharacterized protein (DUF2252 family)
MAAPTKAVLTKRGSKSPLSSVRGSRSELLAAGKALRDKCPRISHAGWQPAKDRPDPVKLVLQAEEGRMPELLPLRHGRMVRSAFTFYRGSALAMAFDLQSTPSTGQYVHCCGDAHLCNFGGFATPERHVIFSVNDLDETLPAPWEWDVKRLAASFVIACRDNNLSGTTAREAVMTCVRTYRESMAEFSQMNTLELWYHKLDIDELVADIKDPNIRRRGIKRLQKERTRSIAEDIFPKLAEHKGEMPIIKDQLPTIFHAEGHPPGEVQKTVQDSLTRYRETLPPSYRSLLDRYQICDAAIKVVGIGSVGTRCWVILFMAGDGDPLFLQVKEARTSVFEPYAGASAFANHGERIVHGYRTMQPASDLFLGWTSSQQGRHFFVRQLRDIKISMRVDTFGVPEMDLYATWCGKALALSHARSGSSTVLSGYMGKSDTFDKAIAAFAAAYADQNESDHDALERAVRKGEVKAVSETNQ